MTLSQYHGQGYNSPAPLREDSLYRFGYRDSCWAHGMMGAPIGNIWGHPARRSYLCTGDAFRMHASFPRMGRL